MGVLLLRVWIYPSLTLTLKVCDAKHDIEPPILTFHNQQKSLKENVMLKSE